MSGSNHNPAHSPASADVKMPVERRRSPLPLAILAALFIIVPFLAWYGTWFGRSLSEQKIEEYLNDTEKARHVQHALAQIEKLIAQRDTRARRWYAKISQLAEHPVTDVRLTVAWVMGADPHAEEFHVRLWQMLEDREPIVRRNAALSLVRFGDPRGRSELRAMLKPYTINASGEGTAMTVLSEGSSVKREAMLVRVRVNDHSFHEVRSPLEGKIEKTFLKEGERVQRGAALFVIAPDQSHLADALVALRVIGETEDLAEVERFAQGVEGLPENIKKEAALTIEAIKRRASSMEGNVNAPSP